MQSFSRALKLALAHRVNIAGCVVSSLLVAVLWGGNLTAVYPVVQVIMNDQSLPQWVDQALAESEMEVAENTRWLAKLNELPAGQADAFRAGIQEEIKHREADLDEHVKNAAGQWNDLQIAEKTRFLKRISDLKSLQQIPAEEISVKVAREKRRAEDQIKVYSKRATRFGWIEPFAHRWMPTTPLRA